MSHFRSDGKAACMTTILQPVLARLATPLALHHEALRPIEDATTPETTPTPDRNTEHPTAIVIVKTTVRAVAAGATVAAAVGARVAAGHIMVKKVERL
ncbi:hypothetical protein BJX99DRAFT_263755 [Aspergillus californicus]